MLCSTLWIATPTRPLPTLPSWARTDAAKLGSQLETIRSQGFAHTHEELAAGATSVAVPLRGKGGKVIAALGLVSPSDSTEISRLVPIMQVTAAALSRKLVESGLGLASRLHAD